MHTDETDITIVKPGIGSFYNINLEAILHANDVDMLLLIGVLTENAILSTVREADDRDYRLVLSIP